MTFWMQRATSLADLLLVNSTFDLWSTGSNVAVAKLISCEGRFLKLFDIRNSRMKLCMHNTIYAEEPTHAFEVLGPWVYRKMSRYFFI